MAAIASAALVTSPALNQQKSHVGPDRAAREALYAQSIASPSCFWSRIAREDYHWEKLWADDKAALRYNFDKKKGPIFVKWFEGAKTNVCYNCLDRHLAQHADRVCFFVEGNDPRRSSIMTYRQVYHEVVQAANVLRTQYGIGKGDIVSLYMPMIPAAAVVMLACARIGAVASVVFGGFSSQALTTRLMDAKAKLLVTADASARATKPILLKQTADAALAEAARLGHPMPCLVFENAERQHCAMQDGRDMWYGDAVRLLDEADREECPIEWMDAEDPLFLLYTSGSTGTPKAILHTTGGYMVYAGTTFKYTFDYHLDDVYFCTADIGWITGHSYVVYGPMLHAATSVLYEGLPNYPSASRWWELVEKHKVSLFYTAPTAIRSLMQLGDEHVTKCNRSSLRVLGSVGEPINAEAWRWYYEVVGDRHVDIVDTFWQTETGGHIVTPLPGCTPQKPGSATLPFFGIVPAILDPMTHKKKEGAVHGLLAIEKPWPGIARTIFNDHERYEKTYFPTDGYYMTGDGAQRDADGYIWITGRVDDVLNVSGHRIGTSEVEDAINSHPAVVESAVVPVPHDIKGESIYVYVTFHQGVTITAKLLDEVKAHVRKIIGPLATPDYIQPAQTGLPKTRSGKIVRRVLRKIATKKYDDLGDVSTLLNPEVVKDLMKAQAQWVYKKKL